MDKEKELTSHANEILGTNITVDDIMSAETLREKEKDIDIAGIKAKIQLLRDDLAVKWIIKSINEGPK